MVSPLSPQQIVTKAMLGHHTASKPSPEVPHDIKRPLEGNLVTPGSSCLRMSVNSAMGQVENRPSVLSHPITSCLHETWTQGSTHLSPPPWYYFSQWPTPVDGIHTCELQAARVPPRATRALSPLLNPLSSGSPSTQALFHSRFAARPELAELALPLLSAHPPAPPHQP